MDHDIRKLISVFHKHPLLDPDRKGYLRYDISQIDVERILKKQDRMYIIHLKGLLEASLSAYKFMMDKSTILFKTHALRTIKQLEDSLILLEKFEREASSYLYSRHFDTSSFKRTDISSTTIDSMPKDRMLGSFRKQQRPLKFVMEEDNSTIIQNRPTSPDSFQLQQDDRHIDLLKHQFSDQNLDSQLSHYNNQQTHRKCQSIPTYDNVPCLKDMMKERLSGHEYDLSPRSFVSYCSFDSYKSYAKALLELDSSMYKGGQELGIRNNMNKTDRGAFYRRRMLLMKGMLSFKIFLIKRRTENRIEKPKIHSKHPFYVVALIKSQFQTFNNYHAQNSHDLEYFQKKLWIIHKSLSSMFKKHSNVNHEKHQMLFNYKHRLMRQALTRLTKNTAKSRKKRELNFLMLQHQLSKYQSVPLYHWMHLRKHRQKRAKKLAKVLKKVVKTTLKPVFAQIVILIANNKFSHLFILEREQFMLSLKKNELEKKSRYLHIQEELDEFDQYLKDTSLGQQELESTNVVSPDKISSISVGKSYQSLDKLYVKSQKPQMLSPKIIEVQIQKKLMNAKAGGVLQAALKSTDKSSRNIQTPKTTFKISLNTTKKQKPQLNSVSKISPANSTTSMKNFKFPANAHSDVQSLRLSSVSSGRINQSMNGLQPSLKSIKINLGNGKASNGQKTPKSEIKNQQKSLMETRKLSLNGKLVKELAKTQRVINLIAKKS